MLAHRVFCAASELFLLLAALFFCLPLFSVIGYAGGGSKRHAVRFALAVALIPVFFFYFLGWASFLGTGRFSIIETVEMWSHNPAQFTQHLLQLSVVKAAAIPAGVLAAAAICAWEIFPRLLRAAPKLQQKAVRAILALITLALILLSFSWFDRDNPAVRAHTGGVMGTFAEVFTSFHATRIGPLNTILAEIYYRWKVGIKTQPPEDLRALCPPPTPPWRV